MASTDTAFRLFFFSCFLLFRWHVNLPIVNAPLFFPGVYGINTVMERGHFHNKGIKHKKIGGT